ncbi:MAG TPA: hypothetical protein VNS29_04240 [Burkholderiaceae bacterium]|nr:hypothetical protein [Burkholderiaceae bacterium]
MTVKVIDHGLDKLMRETHELASLEIASGILPKNFDDAYDNGMTVGEAVIIQTYGTSKIPARDFMGGTADAYREKAGQVMQTQAEKVMDGTLTPAAAAEELGKWFHGRINAHIDNGPWARNAASTIRKKGRDEPLKDTKKLYNAIDHEVRKK